ncbi:hypothetical protein OAB47_01160 [Vicingaceae bacterium]|jgi:hypothetical protein|nr:hypothetical protein [Vicingaceae bacterium]
MLSRNLKLIKKKILLKGKELMYYFPDFFRLLISKGSNDEKQRIVFVGTLIHGRIARIAKWLKRSASYELVFICNYNGYTDKLNNSSFDQVLTYKTVYGLRALLKQFDSPSTIFHTFGPPYEAAETVVRHCERGKKIFDYQDLLVTNFGLNPPFSYMKKDMVKEKYVLKNVDGIVSHSLELQTAKKYYGEILAKKLFFPNYTDNDYFYSPTKVKVNDELSIVYIGSIMSDYRNKDYFGGQMLHWLIHKMEQQKIHFHIYPSPTLLAEHIIDYVELDKNYDYFHLHLSVPQDQLTQELKQYDFGVIPFFHRTNKKLDDKRWFSTTLKMFNFFEAGLPILFGEDLWFQRFMGSKFNGSIAVSWEEFDNLSSKIGQVDYEKMVVSICEKREEYSLKVQINRLLLFYNNL